MITDDNYRVITRQPACEPGDLSAQLIGGYKALNAAFRKCRNCMATNDTMQEKVRTECMFNQKCNYCIQKVAIKPNS